MINLRRNHKGMVLIITYFVLVVLLGLSAVIFMRATNEARLARISNSAQQAFYEAEAGTAYAYYELSRQGFEWYTHNNKDSAAAFPRTEIPQGSNPGEVYIENNCYRIQGREFRLKTYPDPNVAGSGVVVVLSQATVDGISRTIEYRLGQESAYQYFFFFPKTTTFDTATFDGRNFGGIHVNGNIRFVDNPEFRFLTKLTCGWLSQDKGYILRPLRAGFSDCRNNPIYDTTLANPRGLPGYMWTNTTYHFYTGNTYFVTGDYTATPTTRITLPYFLEGAAASWPYDKYDGTRGDTNDKLPLHYDLTYEEAGISHRPLYDLALYEMAEGHDGSITLLDSTKHIVVLGNVDLGNEREVFERLYQRDFTGEHGGILSDLAWSSFWGKWQENHANDYAAYDDNFTGGADWERRFYLAAYDSSYSSDSRWDRTNPGTPYRVNMEWWQDLEYGSDRGTLTDDLAPAQVVNNDTGVEEDQYFLNTKYQGQGGESSAWGRWLHTKNLYQEGELKTLVQDITQSDGNNYLDPGRILDTEEYATHNALKQKAMNGGIYIGVIGGILEWDLNQDGWINVGDEFELWNYYGQTEQWYDPDDPSKTGEHTIPADFNRDGIVDFEDEMIIWEHHGENSSFNNASECIQETQFYNAAHPANYYGQSRNRYRPSNVLVLDVHALKKKIDSGTLQDINGQPISKDDFNGVVYIDLNNYDWSASTSFYDSNARGIMLVNGERLPDNGLSIVTPNNVFIKGNYNLDPYGVSEKNRSPDDPNVINRIIDLTRTYSHYGDIEGTYNLRLPADPDNPESEFDSDYLYWQPAEIITKRAVYTLSEDFPEPLYMPMALNHDQQYNDQTYSQQTSVSGDAQYPTDIWVPLPSATRGVKSRVNKWFTYYQGGAIENPAQWTKTWVNDNWPANTLFNLGDTNRDGQDDYLLSDDLRSDVYSHIEVAYDTRYSYNVVHGSGGWGSATAPSQVNNVSEKHIYNTAIVTPYAVGTYVLEYWGDTARVINGAFIQLPGGPDVEGNSPTNWDYALQTPKAASYYRVDRPAETFNYETRFGRGATVQDQPNIGLTFGADDSWREISSADF